MGSNENVPLKVILPYFYTIIVSSLQTRSEVRDFQRNSLKKNYTAKWLLLEVNTSENYPMKRAMNYIVENKDINISHAVIKFCVS